QEGGRQVPEPLRVGIGVVVNVSHDFALGGLQSQVASVAKSAIRLGDHPVVAVLFAGQGAAQSAIGGADHLKAKMPRDERRIVGGTVIHHDHFVVRIIQ